MKPFLAGEDIRRYCLVESSAVVLLPYHRSRPGDRIAIVAVDELRQDFPNTWKYLLACEERLRGRERGRMNHDEWYGYVYPKNLDVFGRPRIVVRDIVESASFALDTTGSQAFVSGYGIILKREHQQLLLFILGALNSKLLDHFLRSVSTTLRGGWFRAFPQFMGQLPIKLPESASERRDAERVSERVRQIIDAKKKLQATTLGHNERERLERQVEAHEARIDELVCRLYGVDEIPNR